MQRRWQILLISLAAICMTALGIYMAFVGNLEEPPRKGELAAVASVATCNLIWLIPWVLVKRRKVDKPMVWSGVLLFALVWSPFAVRVVLHPRFDPVEWKRALDPNSSYAGHPAHAAGYMVTDIIESGICIGKSITQIEDLLGKCHFMQLEPDPSQRPICIYYFYTNKVLFDGCDKLEICFENDICTSLGFAGCD